MNSTLHIELGTLFMLHYKEWCLFSYSYLKDKEAAEEIVQDVCAKVLIRNDIDKILNLKSYIMVAIKNNCIKMIKEQRKFISLNEIKIDSSSLDDSSLLIEDKLKRLTQALEKLPIISKNIFERCVIDGEKYQDVADSLNISINTVKYHIKSAYKILRLEMIGICLLVLFVIKNLLK